MYVVQRPFGSHVSGELVDLKGAKNLPLLITQRFVRVATAEEIANAEEVPVGAPSDKPKGKGSRKNSKG